MKKGTILVTAAVCSLLSACGGSAAPSSPSSAPASASVSASAKAPAASSAPAGASAKPASSPAAAKPAASSSAAASAASSASPAGSAAAKPGQLGEMTVAEVGGSPSFTASFIATDNHLFEKYGVSVKHLENMAGAAAIAAVVSGQVPVVLEGGSLVQADTTASKLAFYGALQNQFNQFVLGVKPNIKSIADLKGKTIAGSTPGSAASTALELMIKSAGLNPKTDVKWIYAGTATAEWAALQSGQVDGSALTWPYYIEAKKEGIPILADGKEMKLAGASLTIGASREWVRNNPKLMDGYLKALSEAVSIANTDSAKAQESIARHLRKGDTVQDKTEVQDAYDRFGGTFPEPPYITKEAVQEAIDDEPNPAVHQHKPEDYIDNGPLDAIVASGFTKQFTKNS